MSHKPTLRQQRDALAKAASTVLTWLDAAFVRAPMGSIIQILNYLPNGSGGREELRRALELAGEKPPPSPESEWHGRPCSKCGGTGERALHPSRLNPPLRAPKKRGRRV